MFIPIEFNGVRKWANVRIKLIENKWFDSFGEFYTYILEYAEVNEILDEEELIRDLREYITGLMNHENCREEDLINEVMIQYGISRKNAVLLLRAAGFKLSSEDSMWKTGFAEVVIEKLKS